MNEEFYETPEQAASALKFSLLDLLDEWLDEHEVYEENQREVITRAVSKVGFAFFHEELLAHFENADGYEVTIDEEIIYHG